MRQLRHCRTVERRCSLTIWGADSGSSKPRVMVSRISKVNRVRDRGRVGDSKNAVSVSGPRVFRASHDNQSRTDYNSQPTTSSATWSSLSGRIMTLNIQISWKAAPRYKQTVRILSNRVLPVESTISTTSAITAFPIAKSKLLLKTGGRN